jgi:hypothetical protein
MVVTMSQPIDELLLDLLEWIGKQERTYAELMSAWRTSCPRLPVWEEAIDRRLVQRENKTGRGSFVTLTPAGRALLQKRKSIDCKYCHSGKFPVTKNPYRRL